MHSFSFKAIGTVWEIETDKALNTDLRDRILQRIEAFDATYSRFRDDSLVSLMAVAAQGGRFDFPQDSIALFTLYDRLHVATDGAMDPLVGRALERLGYDSGYLLSRALDPTEPEDPEIAVWSKDVVRDAASLITQRPVVIDVGAVGKGYLIDIVCQLLHDAGFDEFLVDGSGDMRHFGASTVRVGLEHPFDPRLAIGVAHLRGRALCASAVNRRVWGKGLHHVLDARTGQPVRDVVATWVIAEDAATADGVASALFFVGQEPLLDQFDFTCVRMFADGHAESSHNFEGELFS